MIYVDAASKFEMFASYPILTNPSANLRFLGRHIQLYTYVYTVVLV